jgi:DDE superfamily endonuclease
VAGWAFQWITQLGFARDSWTAPVDAVRLHPLDNHNQAAVTQVRALLQRLPTSDRAVPLFVFDAGYDPCSLGLGLAQVRAAILVRLRSGRCFYADPPPQPRSVKGGRPRRHGAKLDTGDPTTWPSPTVVHVEDDDQYGRVTCRRGPGCTPSSNCTRPVGPSVPGRSCAAP